METKKMNAEQLIGSALDWSVAKCEVVIKGDPLDIGFILEGGYSPSTQWEQGGLIIDAEIDELIRYRVNPDTVMWSATARGDMECEADGPTALIAAMRCYVKYKLGNEIDVPIEFA